jgi:MtN3 and saliva related transmembrane protein
MQLLVGMIAGVITSVAALPQVVKTIRSRSTGDLSLWQPALLSVGVGLWLAYGILLKNIPLVVMNILPLGTNLMLTVLKLKEKNHGATYLTRRQHKRT